MTMKKKKVCHDRNFPFQIESKVDYVATHRKYVTTQNFLCLSKTMLRNIVATMFFSEKIGHLKLCHDIKK